MCWDAYQRFPSDTQSPAAARRFCVQQLSALLADVPERAGLLDDVTLIVSELITNTINAGATSALVSLSWHRDYLRLSVADDAAGMPALQAATRNETHGRGVAITQSLSQAWGVDPSDHSSEASKQVWAELGVAATLTKALHCDR